MFFNKLYTPSDTHHPSILYASVIYYSCRLMPVGLNDWFNSGFSVSHDLRMQKSTVMQVKVLYQVTRSNARSDNWVRTLCQTTWVFRSRVWKGVHMSTSALCVMYMQVLISKWWLSHRMHALQPPLSIYCCSTPIKSVEIIVRQYLEFLYACRYMVHRLLLAAIGRREPDDRDHYGNKRLDLAGPLLAFLFRGLFRNLIKV